MLSGVYSVSCVKTNHDVSRYLSDLKSITCLICAVPNRYYLWKQNHSAACWIQATAIHMMKDLEQVQDGINSIMRLTQDWYLDRRAKYIPQLRHKIESIYCTNT